MHRSRSLAVACATLSSLATFAPLSAQTVTLTSNEVLRIHFSIASPPSPPPDVLQYGIGLVTVNAPFTTRTSRLWDCDTLLGTAVSPSFGTYSGALSLGVCNSWRETGSVWNFDNPGDVPSFAPLQNATIQGIIDFEIATGSMTVNLANVSMLLVRATSAGGGSVCSPGPVVQEVVVVPKLTGPTPGAVGTVNTWTTTGGTPNSLLLYALSTGCAPFVFPASPPVYFDLALPVVLEVSLADPSGSSALSILVPPAASGFKLNVQAAELLLPTLRISSFATYTFP